MNSYWIAKRIWWVLGLRRFVDIIWRKSFLLSKRTNLLFVKILLYSVIFVMRKNRNDITSKRVFQNRKFNVELLFFLHSNFTQMNKSKPRSPSLSSTLALSTSFSDFLSIYNRRCLKSKEWATFCFGNIYNILYLPLPFPTFIFLQIFLICQLACFKLVRNFLFFTANMQGVLHFKPINSEFADFLQLLLRLHLTIVKSTSRFIFHFYFANGNTSLECFPPVMCFGICNDDLHEGIDV